MNYGLDIDREIREQSDEDWVGGVAPLTCLGFIPEELREQYLPVGEVQRGKEDTMDCASRAPINILEAKFTYAYQNDLFSFEQTRFLRTNGYIANNRVVFSDAFIAIKSGTTRTGNSLKAPLEAIRKNGLIPKHLLPLLPDMSWSEYHDPDRISLYMEQLGKKFLTHFQINYEKVYDIPKWQGEYFLVVGGFAWSIPQEGVYPPVDSRPNHAFVLYKTPKYYAFDNYIDSVDGDFIKKLDPAYKFLDYGYNVVIRNPIQLSLWERILNFFSKFLKQG